jgi:hypothetical protein
MSKKIIIVFFTIFLCGSAALAQGTAKAAVKDLAWLSGCWQNSDKSADVTLEQWLSPAGGVMFGIGRTIKNDKLAEYEYTRIWQDDKGDLYFAAKLPKQDEAAFKLISAAGGEFIFENPEHDFPQRVIYKNTGKDTMAGRIEGKNNGKEMAFDYPMKRAQCK